jgi:hypothetical protein
MVEARPIGIDPVDPVKRRFGSIKLGFGTLVHDSLPINRKRYWAENDRTPQS